MAAWWAKGRSVNADPRSLRVTAARYRFEHYCTIQHLWERYDDAASERISRAFAAAPAGGVVALEGLPFEVRWGSAATSRRLARRPYSGVIQVNVTTENTRLVRRCRVATLVSEPRP